MVERIEADRKTDQQALVINQVNRAVNLNKDDDKATQILQDHRSLFDQNDFEDTLLKIDTAHKTKIEETERDYQWSNVSSFQSQIATGSFDNRNSQQMLWISKKKTLEGILLNAGNGTLW